MAKQAIIVPLKAKTRQTHILFSC